MREGLQKIVSVDDTIVAISTPIGRSGIGVVRLSGKEVRRIAARLLKSASTVEHRTAVVGEWTDESGTRIDQVVATLFESPNSYTGEDVLEVSAHGNPFILSEIVATICTAGARVATPGEFTLRAVMHGKMDLIQAEGVLDFIEAQTQTQARTALQQVSGALSQRVAPIKDRLVDLIAHTEAGIDFAEDDVELPSVQALAGKVNDIREKLLELQRTYAFGKLLSTGLRLAIVGKPNVGKSSLFNRLVAADRAIVTDIPGTTRDVLAETINLDGVPLRFFDTAGLRQTSDQVERIGVSRTIETLSDADVALVVLDGSLDWNDEDRDVLARVRTVQHIAVINKSDLPQRLDISALNGTRTVRVSARTGAGLDDLQNALRAVLNESPAEVLSDSIVTSARQNEAIMKAVCALEKAGTAVSAGTPHEMVLLDLYSALGALNELTGEVVTEDILGRIFSSFCIGK